METQGHLMKRTPLTQAVLDFLERDRIATLNLVGVLRNGPGRELLVDDDQDPKGVLVKGHGFWYLHTRDEGFLEAVCRELARRDGFYRFSGVWKPLADKLKARFPVVWDAPCDLYHFPPDHPCPEPGEPRPRSLEVGDAELIDRHYTYRHPGSLEEIRACIRDRPSSAVDVDGSPVCWLLVHDDDSLGIMYTLEEHRRKGYAEAVTRDLVRKLLAAGRTPFLQIRDDNGMSPGLALKCGFVREGNCDWFGLMAGMPRMLVEGAKALRNLAVEDPRAPASACLFRFLSTLPPGSGEGIEAADDDRAWLAFASRHFGEVLSEPLVGELKAHGRLLWERREGAVTGVAALLSKEPHEDGELRWWAGREEGFLLRALQKARALGFEVVCVHVTEEERPVFEKIGFRQAYSVKDP